MTNPLLSIPGLALIESFAPAAASAPFYGMIITMVLNWGYQKYMYHKRVVAKRRKKEAAKLAKVKENA